MVGECQWLPGSDMEMLCSLPDVHGAADWGSARAVVLYTKLI